MGWNFSNPLYTLNTDDNVERAKDLWEGESLGGLTEDNNRLPVPVVGLLALTIITAFLVTAPLWGQRPKAHIFEGLVDNMNNPKVVAAKDDASAMKELMASLSPAYMEKHRGQLLKHPIDMDDLRAIAPQIKALKGKDLEEYTVVGSQIVLANFEGKMVTTAAGVTKQERKQPWWDKGYSIDVFYVLYFCLTVMTVVKRLPPYTWQPDHTKHAGAGAHADDQVAVGGAKAVGEG